MSDDLKLDITYEREIFFNPGTFAKIINSKKATIMIYGEEGAVCFRTNENVISSRVPFLMRTRMC